MEYLVIRWRARAEEPRTSKTRQPGWTDAVALALGRPPKAYEEGWTEPARVNERAKRASLEKKYLRPVRSKQVTNDALQRRQSDREKCENACMHGLRVAVVVVVTHACLNRNRQGFC